MNDKKIWKCSICGSMTQASSEVDAKENLREFRPICRIGWNEEHHPEFYRHRFNPMRLKDIK